MSNTVHFYALTGEKREGKSLSTADDVAARFAEKLLQRHHVYVPIVWHDVDFPLARIVGDTRVVYSFPHFGPVDRIVDAVVALGGDAVQPLVPGHGVLEGPWQRHRSVTCRLPRELDLDLLTAWREAISVDQSGIVVP